MHLGFPHSILNKNLLIGNYVRKKCKKVVPDFQNRMATFFVLKWKACRKPGSVPRVVITGINPPTNEATIIYLGRTLLHGSSDQPERASG